MKKGLLILIAVLLVLGAASYATVRLIRAERHPRGPVPHGFGMLQSHLELTPDQRKAMAEVDAKYAKTRPALREKLWEAGDDLMAVLHDPDSTLQQAEAAAKTFAAAQQDMQLNTIRYTYELRKHLTPAQREKLISTMGRGMGALAGGPPPGRGRGRGMGPRHMRHNGPPGYPGPPGPPPPPGPKGRW